MEQYIKDNFEQYTTNLEKVNNGEWTLQQWSDYCSWLLCQIMAKGLCEHAQKA